jgi:hypothetical protein
MRRSGYRSAALAALPLATPATGRPVRYRQPMQKVGAEGSDPPLKCTGLDTFQTYPEVPRPRKRGGESVAAGVDAALMDGSPGNRYPAPPELPSAFLKAGVCPPPPPPKLQSLIRR